MNFRENYKGDYVIYYGASEKKTIEQGLFTVNYWANNVHIRKYDT